ncbi:hypothetical protein A2625_01245 [candidate division WOR-1 bacterium RIFCSPHIGHO2_01_FULL_53_15]|uniref:Transposase IS200-like domain-containing protein n=1 Tax=candidate division WOR-1 bacterium RIFCSPHIGHO2_01_FULL_53_15 TaxID=1802564 RepID=A0A1F4Q0T6_UNCSA|nr:MAG: hypothetical protein A2625_01245 [candidate division WOR-1 bacterium RIFCSPHIGHO2_01_FULL_53_15]OGC12996.1 MAG: hypothetical protein A3D23_03950 [candidate division WOR-1 bacterium RIFCSPHIGHO2_02_FULL_53_26]
MKKQDILPIRKAIRLEGHDYSALHAYFITISSFDRNQYFVKDDFNESIVRCIKEEAKRNDFLVYVYCLMPDHLHLLLSPPGDGASVSGFIGGLKSKTTRIAWNFSIHGKLWQGRFHDHILRKKEKMNVVGEYILNNPVRKGIADNWRKYKYCGIMNYWI